MEHWLSIYLHSSPRAADFSLHETAATRAAPLPLPSDDNISLN